MGIFFNKESIYQSRYKQVEMWINEPGYRWVDGENIYVPGWWVNSSTPIDSESERYEKWIVEHIEQNYLYEGAFEKSNLSLNKWMLDIGFKITDCKVSTVKFYSKEIKEWGR